MKEHKGKKEQTEGVVGCYVMFVRFFDIFFEEVHFDAVIFFAILDKVVIRRSDPFSK
jgi:hypothetical protein